MQTVDLDVPLTSEEISRPSFIDTELFIREDGDPIEPFQQYSTMMDESELITSDLPETTADEHDDDDDFERDFLRAVDRALGVVNKEPIEQIKSTPLAPPETDLTQMTELALASFENSALFTVSDDWRRSNHLNWIFRMRRSILLFDHFLMTLLIKSMKSR